jgi:hypothetical protein
VLHSWIDVLVCKRMWHCWDICICRNTWRLFYFYESLTISPYYISCIYSMLHQNHPPHNQLSPIQVMSLIHPPCKFTIRTSPCLPSGSKHPPYISKLRSLHHPAPTTSKKKAKKDRANAYKRREQGLNLRSQRNKMEFSKRNSSLAR